MSLEPPQRSFGDPGWRDGQRLARALSELVNELKRRRDRLR